MVIPAKKPTLPYDRQSTTCRNTSSILTLYLPNIQMRPVSTIARHPRVEAYVPISLALSVPEYVLDGR
jgi:hypothetical protein